MKNTYKFWFFVFLGAFTVLAFYTYKKDITHEVKEKIIIDTVFFKNPKADTVFFNKTKIVYLPKIDTISRQDTVCLHDSTLVEVPISTYEFRRDSIFYAKISGYSVSLDTLCVWNKTRTIETVKYRQRRFGLGISAGLGFNGNKLAPYLGVGIYWRLW